MVLATSQRAWIRAPLIIGVFILIPLIPLLLFLSIESYFAPYPYIDTQFTTDFSWEKFEKVAVGMDQDEVQSLLGSPFEKTMYMTGPGGTCGAREGGTECWIYSEDSNFPYWDFAWIAVIVRFDDNVVDGKQEIIMHN